MERSAGFSSPRIEGPKLANAMVTLCDTYGLDIWPAHKKVLNVEWSEEGLIEIISYRPGEWEDQLLPFSKGGR